MKSNRILLAIVILLGLGLRTWRLSQLPAGFTADEASHGYDAYSLLLTGKDQWGQPWPVAFRSFGDFKLPVYTYLDLPFIALGGLNEFMVRLPGALIGTLAILATYLFVNELFKEKNQLSKTSISLFAALLLAVSPWHLQLSRGAVEANLTSFFAPLALWAWLKGLQFARNWKLPRRGPFGETASKRPLWGKFNYWFIFTAILLGINLYTYHAARAFTLLLIPLLTFVTWKQINVFLPQLITKNLFPILTFIVFLVPMGISLLSGGSSRGLDVAVFNPTDQWLSLSNLRHEVVLSGLPDSLARLTTNKLTYTVKEFSSNYFTYLSPYFLFIQGPGEATYGMLPGRGVLYWFELPLIFIALIYAIRRPSFPSNLLLVLIILAPIPAALSKGHGLAANRATPMLPFIHVLSAYGLAILINKLHNYNKLIKNFSYLFLSSLILLFLCFFLKDYLIHAPKIQAQAMSYGWKQAVPLINQLQDHYDHIIVSRKFNQPHIFLMFYTPIPPQHIQQLSSQWLAYEKQGLNFVDQQGQYQLDKFTFLEIQTEHLHQPNTLIIARPADFLTPKPTIKEVMRPAYPQPTPAIIFINTNHLSST